MVSTSTLLTSITALTSLVVAAPIVTTEKRTPICLQEGQNAGIISPATSASWIQIQDSSYGSNTFEILYCSGQYGKTKSVDLSVWLSFPETLNTGLLIAKDVKPDNVDVYAGYYSYRFNVTIFPEDGSYLTGEKTLTAYETTTGYYNPYNFELSSTNITLSVVQSSP